MDILLLKLQTEINDFVLETMPKNIYSTKKDMLVIFDPPPPQPTHTLTFVVFGPCVWQCFHLKVGDKESYKCYNQVAQKSSSLNV